MALKKCEECGKEFSEYAESCPNCGNPNKKQEIIAEELITEKVDTTTNINDNKKGKWSNSKLIIGIISMVLFILIAIQSCAAGVSNTLSENGATSGSAGIGCALFMLIGGIITVVTRNSRGKGGAIAAIILYWLAAIITIGTGNTYGDLPIWGSVAFCFGLVNLGSILANIDSFKESKKQNILIGAVIIISIIAFVIGAISGTAKDENNNSSTNNQTNNSSENNNSSKSNNSSSSTTDSTTNNKNTYSLGYTFTFDDLEITIENNITFTTIDNEYSDYNGRDVVVLPVTVKNLKDETHGLNMFNYKVYGSQGTELDTVSSYFDDALDYAGDLRTNASYTKNMYFLYDGNGEYALEFDDWSNKITVEFNVSK